MASSGGCRVVDAQSPATLGRDLCRCADRGVSKQEFVTSVTNRASQSQLERPGQFQFMCAGNESAVEILSGGRTLKIQGARTAHGPRHGRLHDWNRSDDQSFTRRMSGLRSNEKKKTGWRLSGLLWRGNSLLIPDSPVRAQQASLPPKQSAQALREF